MARLRIIGPRLTRLLIFVGVTTFFALSLVYSQSGQYPEVSPYAGVVFGISPIIVFIFSILILGFTSGFLLVHSSKESFNLALGMELFGSTLLQILPSLKGYFFYGVFDPSSHIGFITAIAATGNIPPADYYPVFHLVGVSLVQVAAIPVLALVPVIQLATFGIFALGVRSLSNALFQSLSARRLVLLMVPAFYAPSQFRPQSLALAMIPLLLYLFIFSQNRKGSVLLILLSIALTFTHPVVALVLVLSVYTWALLSRNSLLAKKGLILASTFAIWMVYNVWLMGALQAVIVGFEVAFSPIATHALQTAANLGGLSSFSILIREITLIPLLGLVESAIYLRFRRTIKAPLQILVMFLVFSLLLFPATVVISSFILSPARFPPYVCVVVIPLVGLVASNKRRGRTTEILVLLSLLVILMSSTLVSYESWYNYQASGQVTQNMYTSFSFLFDRLIPQTAIGGPQLVSTDLWNLIKGEPPSEVYPFVSFQVGPHFNLSGGLQEGTNILVITKVAQLGYLTVYKPANIYNSSDYRNLNTQPNLELVYSGPDVILYASTKS